MKVSLYGWFTVLLLWIKPKKVKVCRHFKDNKKPTLKIANSVLFSEFKINQKYITLISGQEERSNGQKAPKLDRYPCQRLLPLSGTYTIYSWKWQTCPYNTFLTLVPIQYVTDIGTYKNISDIGTCTICNWHRNLYNTFLTLVPIQYVTDIGTYKNISDIGTCTICNWHRNLYKIFLT